MNLYKQLLYNWERGFYSVVKHKEGGFLIVTCYKKQAFDDWYQDREGMQYTDVYPSVEEAKANIFSCDLCLSRGNPHAQDNWKIVDTIHPSELMGKGFQVGDKVIIPGKLGFEGEVVDIEDDRGTAPVYTVEFDDTNDCFHQTELKPVLPQEEKCCSGHTALECTKKCMCHVSQDVRDQINRRCSQIPTIAEGAHSPQLKEKREKVLERYVNKENPCIHDMEEVLKAYDFPEREEKKECEHKICIKYPLQKNIPLDKVDFFLYCCTNPKCGLVTCIDPNK